MTEGLDLDSTGRARGGRHSTYLRRSRPCEHAPLGWRRGSCDALFLVGFNVERNESRPGASTTSNQMGESAGKCTRSPEWILPLLPQGNPEPW